MTACKIEKNVYGGDGLARVDGMVVFVSGAYAGETVVAEEVQRKRNFARARLVEVVESPYRPAGPVAPGVPGMVYAGLPPAVETEVKLAQLADFLRQAGVDGDAAVEADAGEVDFLNYRNKAVYHLEGGRLGYRAEPSHEVVDVESDPLACPQINAALAGIRAAVLASSPAPAEPRGGGRAGLREGARVCVRYTPADGVKWWRGRPPAGLTLHERTGGVDFLVAADGFYQVNPLVGERLVAEAVAAYLEAPGDLLDLYCGVGVFGVCCLKALAGKGGGARCTLVGVESARGSVADAKRNAAAAGVPARFFCERVGGSLTRLKAKGKTVVVDPPRGGMERGVAEWLARSGAERILSVSCDPATLARDLKALGAGYRVRRVKYFNMFPRTARFETFAVLERRQPVPRAGRFSH